MKVSIEFELSQKFLRGVLCTAFEGGTGYWLCLHEIERKFDNPLNPDDGSFEYVKAVGYEDGYDPETGEGGESEESGPWTIDEQVIALGIQRILAGIVKVRSDIIGWIIDDVANQEEGGGSIDADAADCIVQAGLFNEVRYG